MEEATDPGFAEVGIDQHRAVAELRERNREIRGSGRLAFPRESASDQNDWRRMIGLREKNGSAQGAKRFRHLRLGQVLSNELDAFVMPVGREALQNAMAFAAAVGICKLRHHSERRQPRKSFDVVRSLHGIVEILAHQSQADRSEEHTSELQSHLNLVCRLLLEKKKKTSHAAYCSLI